MMERYSPSISPNSSSCTTYNRGGNSEKTARAKGEKTTLGTEQTRADKSE